MKNVKSVFSCWMALLLLSVIFYSPEVHAATATPLVKVKDGTLWVDYTRTGVYQPYLIKAVGYSPMPIGRHPSDWGAPAGSSRSNNIYDDQAILTRDFTLLKQMNANTIRIWKGNNTTASNGRYPNKITTRTLDMALQNNIRVIAGFYVDPLSFNANNTISSTQRADLIARFTSYVNAFKNHQAILFWAIGNENNYQSNGMSAAQLSAWYALVNDMAKAAHTAEGAAFHPVAVVNGEIGTIGASAYGSTDAKLPYLDIWGANIYRGVSFGTLFSEYSAKSRKPLWISEFGIDAWAGTNPGNFDLGREDENTQSLWDGLLWDEIARQSTGVLGGSLMEYSDEWWKPYEWLCGNNSDVCNSTQNHYGEYPFASPDNIANEEWYGVMAIKYNPNPQNPDIVTPRKVYNNLRIKWESDPWADLGVTQFYPGAPAKGDISGTRFTANAGEKINLVVSYGNHGRLTAPASKISFYADGVLLSATSIAATPVNGAGSTTSSVAWVAKEGTHDLKVVLDTDNQVPESNKADNTVIKTITVTADLVPPTIANGAPAGQLPYGTKSATLIVTTDEDATCKYSTKAGVVYKSMTAFKSTGTRAHSSPITGLTNGVTKQYYVKCQDKSAHLNVTPSDYLIQFSVAPPQPPTAPANVNAVATDKTHVSLSWDLSTGPGTITYKIYRATVSSTGKVGAFTLVGLTPQNQWLNSGLKKATTYQYYIVATSAQGLSPASGKVQVTTAS